MHLLKTLVSTLLVVASLLWLAIQQLFLPSEIIRSILQSSNNAGFVNYVSIKRDWCRVRSKRVTWREMLEPCRELGFLMKHPKYATDPAFSGVASMFISPAGEHTKIRIDTYTQYGTQKTFGGDSLRVMFRGPQTVAATVFDLRNGSYEALAMLMVPGTYKIDIRLDYTQCKGLKEPPTEWYVKAHCSGLSRNRTHFISQEILADMREYINQPISAGLSIEVPPPRYDLKEFPFIVRNLDCGFNCDLTWDGYGGWNEEGTEWIPSVEPLWKDKISNEGTKNRSTLWIYGDSISYYFHKRIEQKKICNGTFNKCGNTYNWIYPKILYEMRHTCDDIDVSIDKVRTFFREMLLNPDMDKNSALIFNAGAHYVKNTSFRKYRDIIDALIEELKNTYRGKAIWKSSNAIHEQYIAVMGAFRRFITGQRLQLFNAYANAAMCNSDIRVLDVHPLTASYPFGTIDGVHYERNVSKPIESLINGYFEMLP